ncbi:hypothetical protein AYO21_00322 [Fonsecaea monophora]|uniref:Alpha/beta hydrolase fold-3 domain-containing protein n=1 Tax=Fonsecaea monophora TaxID=254056 RepID=A0A177FPP1_9EURO|nr:hypothetical protein AYO21_00322 [Fonsecaea monophora]KAH0832778.1 hypothetical protein FOPE_01347 [Fonsecaea pedrosoi]OAG45686.1 hypothetical protein AYO21_00322 [Fonsecaea monophora]
MAAVAVATATAPTRAETHSRNSNGDRHDQQPGPEPQPQQHFGGFGGGGGVQITTRTDLSFLYRALRAVMKPLRPRLVQLGGSAQPAGSPRLSPPRKRGVQITETRCADVWMYRYRVNARAGEGGKARGRRGGGRDERGGGGGGERGRRVHHVYYFCGGGFQSPPSSEHWRFVAQLAQDLARHRSSSTSPVDVNDGGKHHDEPHKNTDTDTEIELVLVSYPLAPKNPASESLRILRKWLTTVMDEVAAKGNTLSLAGDSSGGNVVLSLGFWAVQNYGVGPSQHQQQQQQQQSQQVHSRTETPLATGDDDDNDLTKCTNEGPGMRSREGKFSLTALISISGPTDLTNTNPEIRKADQLDCLLTEKTTREVAQVWTANDDSNGTANKKKQNSPSHEPTPLTDPSVSPLLNPDAAFHALKERQVHVHGVLGTHDVLAPDAIAFMHKCQRLGLTGQWLVWEGQMHCFPLAGGEGWLGIREGREAREFIESVFRRESGREDANHV